jgi:hypothetical protein
MFSAGGGCLWFYARPHVWIKERIVKRLWQTSNIIKNIPNRLSDKNKAIG